MSDTPTLELLIESLLFVGPEPVELARLEQVLGVSRSEVEVTLARMAEDCRSRGVRLQRQGEVVQLVTAPEAAAVVERFLGAQSRSKLSPAALETLAIVAYRQPVTRAQIEAVRGVNCERALATLQTRNLIAEVGRQDKVGRPILFGTTMGFLEYFGLTSLADLPPVDEGDREGQGSKAGSGGEGEEDGQALPGTPDPDGLAPSDTSPRGSAASARQTQPARRRAEPDSSAHGFDAMTIRRSATCSETLAGRPRPR